MNAFIIFSMLFFLGILVFTDVNYFVSDSTTVASLSPPENLDPSILNGTIINVQSPEN